MILRREDVCRSCGKWLYCDEEAHAVAGGVLQCCQCYEGDEPCRLRWPVECNKQGGATE